MQQHDGQSRGIFARFAAALRNDWRASLARPEQLPPPGVWTTWVFCAGRGAGKTRSCAEWIRERVETGVGRRIHLVAPTAADARDVMVEGASGILASGSAHMRPTYLPSLHRIEWPNGAQALLFSSDEPDRVTMKAIENWTMAPLRTAGNFAYENMTFAQIAQIAQAVASRHGWQCINLPTSPDVPWNRRTQTLEHGGDLAFLRKIANEANYEFNVKPPNVIFYSRAAIDAQTPANTLPRSIVTRYNFRYQTSGEITFGASQISYLDPHTKQLITAGAQVTENPPTADTLNMVERLENAQQGTLRAVSRLAEHDMLVYQATVTMPGTILYRAGQTVSLPPADWGIFGRTWTMSRATHRIRARAGYTTELLLRQLPPGITVTPGGVPFSTGE